MKSHPEFEIYDVRNIGDSKGQCIALMDSGGGAFSPETVEANARMMAASKKLAGIAARTLRLHEQQGKITFKDRRVSLASFNRYAAKYHPRLRALTIEQVYESRA